MKDLKTIRPILKTLLLLNFLILVVTNSYATEETTPLNFVQAITNAMIEDLNVSKAEIQKDPSLVLAIVNKRVMPHIAKITIARKVMGLVWKKSSALQKQKFVNEFTIYLKRFYSKSLLSFNEQTIKFSPDVRTKGKKLAIVSTQLIRKGHTPIEIKYKLYRKKDGWKVIDLIIEGISLVVSNQRQYAGLIAREGLDTVTAKLSYNNKQEFK